MNLIMVGGVVLSAFLVSPDVSKAPTDTMISAPVQQLAALPVQKTESPKKAVQAAARKVEDRGWMSREISIDQKTGETTEISVIGFAD